MRMKMKTKCISISALSLHGQSYWIGYNSAQKNTKTADPLGARQANVATLPKRWPDPLEASRCCSCRLQRCTAGAVATFLTSYPAVRIDLSPGTLRCLYTRPGPSAALSYTQPTAPQRCWHHRRSCLPQA